MTAILLAFLTCSIVFSVLVLSAMQMKTDEERAAEDAEFVRQYAKRRGDWT